MFSTFRETVRRWIPRSPLFRGALRPERLIELDKLVRGDSRRFFAELDAFRRRMMNCAGDGQRLALLLHVIKLSNLMVMKHHYAHRHIRVAGRPFGYQIDVLNGCNLGCSGCPQTYNKRYAQETYTFWPRAVMKREVHQETMTYLGLHAFAGHYYNTSEPLLNKRLTDYIVEANRRQIRTSISSHMSVPKLDVESVVESGLDVLQIAVDGVTQPVYQRYRRGGIVELVFDNVRRLVEAKKRLGRENPTIRWHYLTFEHNVHEIEMAIAKAQELEINSFFLASPVDVSADDPSMTVVYHPRQWQEMVLRKAPHAPFARRLEPLAEEIECSVAESLLERFEALQTMQGESHLDDRCDWLYMGAYVNAFGVVFPCNIGDVKGGPGALVFGSVRDGSFDFNSPEYQIARSAMNNGTDAGCGMQVRCQDCGGRPTPQIGLRATMPALQGLAGCGQWLTPEVLARLCAWSEHKIVPPGVQQPPAAMRC